MPITTQPSAGKPAGASGDFQNGLFGCACGSCIKALCCPCLIAKDVANEVGDSGTLWCLGYLAGIFTGYLVSYFKTVGTVNSIRHKKLRDFRILTSVLFSQCTCAFVTNVVSCVKIVALTVAAAQISSCRTCVRAVFSPKWIVK